MHSRRAVKRGLNPTSGISNDFRLLANGSLLLRVRVVTVTSLMRTTMLVLALSAALLAQSSSAQAAVLNDSLAQSVNNYRASSGLPSVVASPTLQAAAQFMAEDAAAHGVPTPAHYSTDGRNPVQRMADAGYPTNLYQIGEIIAWGNTTASATMTQWLNSPTHLAVLNDPAYHAAGFGVSCGNVIGCVWVVDFGAVLDQTFASPAPAPAVVLPPSPTYHAAFYAQSAYPTAAPGQVVQWVVAFTNTGNTGWSATRLGTSNPQDAASFLQAYSWVAPNRPAQQTTTWVAPGQQAWFVVNLTAPSQPGTYRLYVRPVIDGVTWLEDLGAYVDLVVR